MKNTVTKMNIRLNSRSDEGRGLNQQLGRLVEHTQSEQQKETIFKNENI